MAAWTSFFKTLPFLPVPVSWLGSISFSAANFFTAAEIFTSLVTGASAPVAGSGASWASLVGLPAPSAIVATTAPMATSSPSGEMIFRTPLRSAVISVEILSVSSVSSRSPSFTWSPSAACHWAIRPLVIDSPTVGILTSKLMVG